MSATIQVRRGTASQWTTANPTLAAGEIGFESDTNKIKIGNGSTAWSSLSYAAGGNQFETSIVFEGATADSYETTLTATDPTADRTITLPDASGTVVLADGSGNVTVSGNLTVSGTTTTVNSTEITVQNALTFEGTTADAFETTLTVVDPTADRTITFKDATGTVAFVSDIPSLTGYVTETASQTLTNKSIDLTSNTLTTTLAQLNTAVSDADVASIAGAETLTNKTLASAVATTALTLNATAELRLADTDSSHYVGFKSPGTVSTNRIWTLPSVDGTSGQALQTNGSGTLSWASVSSDANPQVFMLMGA
jgi:hypothetical protein